MRLATNYPRTQFSSQKMTNKVFRNFETFIGLQNVLKISSRHRIFCSQELLMVFWRHLTKPLVDVLKYILEDKKLLRWRCLQDVLRECLADIFKTCLQDAFKASWRRQIKILLGIAVSSKSKSVSSKSISHKSVSDDSIANPNSINQNPMKPKQYFVFEN